MTGCVSCSVFILSKFEKKIEVDFQCPGSFQDEVHPLARPVTAGPEVHFFTHLLRFKFNSRGDYTKGP